MKLDDMLYIALWVTLFAMTYFILLAPDKWLAYTFSDLWKDLKRLISK